MNPYVPVLAAFLVTRILSYFFLTVATEPELYLKYATAVDRTSLANLYRGEITRSYPFTSELQTQPPEYPQLTALFLTPPLWLAEAFPGIARLTEHRPRSYPPEVAAYEATLGLQLFAVDVLLLVLVHAAARRLYPDDSRGLGAARLGLYVAASAIFVPVWFDRLDTVVGVFVVGAVLAFAKDRRILAYSLLVAGAGFKLVPLLLLPVWVMAAASRESQEGRGFLMRTVREAALAGTILTAGITLVALVGGGWSAFRFLEPHAARGIQPESSYTLPIVLADPGTRVIFSHGGFHLSGSLADRAVPFTSAALALLLLASYAVAWRASRIGSPAQLPMAAMLTLIAFLLGSKVGSPQYAIWLMPLAPFLPLPERAAWRWAAWFLVLCAIMTLLFPLASGHISGPRLTQETWAGPTAFGLALVAARTLILAGLAVWLARWLWKCTATPAQA